MLVGNAYFHNIRKPQPPNTPLRLIPPLILITSSSSLSSLSISEMTTALHTPSHSPQPSEFFSRQPQRQMNSDYSFSLGFSPKRHSSATPSKKQPSRLPSFSPINNRLDLNNLDAAMQLDFDDFSSATAAFSTPFRPPVSRATGRQPRFKPSQDPFDPSRRQKTPLDEEELFFGSRAAHMSLPLRTPERSPLELPGVAHSFDSVPSPSHPPKRKVSIEVWR